MNVLLDTNVVLDVLLDRVAWVNEASKVWDAHHQGRLTAYVAAFSIPTIFYVVRRQNDLTSAQEAVCVCLEGLQIAAVGRSTLELARRQDPSDYEDSLQIAAALEAGVDAIVTRDPAGFTQSPVRAIYWLNCRRTMRPQKSQNDRRRQQPVPRPSQACACDLASAEAARGE